MGALGILRHATTLGCHPLLYLLSWYPQYGEKTMKHSLRFLDVNVLSFRLSAKRKQRGWESRSRALSSLYVILLNCHLYI